MGRHRITGNGAHHIMTYTILVLFAPIILMGVAILIAEE